MNLSELFLSLSSNGLIGAIIGIGLLYLGVFIPLKTLYCIYISGGLNGEMISRVTFQSRFEVWRERACVLPYLFIFAIIWLG